MVLLEQIAEHQIQLNKARTAVIFIQHSLQLKRKARTHFFLPYGGGKTIIQQGKQN